MSSEQFYRRVEIPYLGCPDCGYNGCKSCFEFQKVEPDAWGITTWRQLYDNMTVAENDGDWLECTEALGAALGIGGDDE